MKIMFLIDSLEAGGAEWSTVLLATSLRSMGIDASITTLRQTDGGFAAEAREYRVPLRHLNGSSPARHVRQLRRLLRSEQPDIVHTALFNADQVGRFAAIGLSTRVVSSLVNAPRVPGADALAAAWKVRLVNAFDIVTSRLLVKRFHAVTEGVAVASIRQLHLRADVVTVVERGRDPDRLGVRSPARRARVRAAVHWPADESVVLAVGRHEFDKAHLALIDAFVMLSHDRSRVRLAIVGREGAMTRRLMDAIAEHELDECVELLGHRADVADLIAASDVLVSSSTREGAAGVVIEAMAIGTPIVATALPGLDGVLCSHLNALTVSPGDQRALGAAICQMLDDDALATRLARQARADFEERFTLETSTNAMIALYELVIASP